MRSPKFKEIKDCRDNGLWKIKRMYNVVGKDEGITPEEYEEITGEKYEK